MAVKSDRIPELDALRGLAALTILIYHAYYVFDYPVMRLGVDLFFVLSGYLITSIILREQSQSGFLKTFLIRRGLRIYPIYYVALTLAIVLNPWFPNRQPLDGWWQFATYTQNIQRYWFGEPPFFHKHFGHSWTLAIEEQFYLVWPILLLVMGKRILPWLIVGLLTMSAGLRAWGVWPHLLGTRCDGLVLGAALAWLLRFYEPTSAKRWSMGFIAAGILGFAFPFFWLTYRGERWPLMSDQFASSASNALLLPFINLGFLGVVGLAIVHSGQKWLWPLRWSWLRGAGVISYGLYLYHPMIFPLVHQLSQFTGWGYKSETRAKIIASILVAIVSWFLIERPILSLKRRFEYQSPSEDTVESNLTHANISTMTKRGSA